MSVGEPTILLIWKHLMITNLDIPDPFQTFVAKKYANAKGYVHDFFTGEWSYKCSACKYDLYAPSRKIMTKIRLFHTRNECLGGY
jgi:hypothetical protein